jgi:hypothetical protein
VTAEPEPQDCDALKAAVSATKETDTSRKRFLIKKSVELGCVEHIPDDWEVTIDD